MAVVHTTDMPAAGARSFCVLVNNLVLALGFWVGCFGSFKPTIYFSLLSGITIVSALLCDLWVTPACLNLFDRRRRAPT